MKVAYPNWAEIPATPPYDLNKWMSSMRDLYVKMHMGASQQDALNEVTKEWPKIEKTDFQYWLRYYQSGDQLKYKKAQSNFYVSQEIPNYYLPNQKFTPPSPIKPIDNQIAEAVAPPPPPKEDPEVERKRIVEDHRRKLIGRLNSAEKLLTSHQGQIFAGKDFERLLAAIYQLKRDIQLVNKVNASMQTCVDLIVKQANILKREGFAEAYEFMVKFAQNTPGNFTAQLGEIPLAGSQPQGLGALSNNLPIGAITEHKKDPTATDEEEKEPKDGIAGFLDNLEGAGVTLFDKNDSKDEVDLDEDIVLDEEVIPDAELKAEAQLAPPPDAVPPAPMPKKPARPKANMAPAELEVEEPAAKPQSAPNSNPLNENKYDALINATFENLTIADVVSELEDISKIFRNREIARKLAIADLMLNKLGLAEMFPSLGEVVSKNLDAGQYCITRLEDIISRLRASVYVSDVKLTHSPEPSTDEARNAKRSLENSENKDKERRLLRQKLQDEQMAEKIKPEVENPEAELAAEPTEIEGAPAPIKPAAKPVAPAAPIPPTV